MLLLEGVSRTAVETFAAAGYTQIELHDKSLSEDELKRRIAEAHLVGIRSRSQLTAEVFEHARKLIAAQRLRVDHHRSPVGRAFLALDPLDSADPLLEIGRAHV